MTSLILDNPKIGEEAFELIWENTNDAIFLIGQDGAILQANPTFTEILGWTIEELKGLTLPPSLHNMTKEQQEAFLNKLRDGGNVNYSLTKRRCKDGEILDILATYRAINNGELLAVGMYKDFSDKWKSRGSWRKVKSVIVNLLNSYLMQLLFKINIILSL